MLEYYVVELLHASARKLLLLENVLALLSGNKECRKLLNYILKARLRVDFYFSLPEFHPARQECRARDLDLYWTSNRMRNVGLQACVSEAQQEQTKQWGVDVFSLTGQSLSNFNGCEANRPRVFLLACVKGFKGPQDPNENKHHSVYEASAFGPTDLAH